MIRSTFSGFTTAQLAMRASQKALDVTGQNISNINTGGYSRQRVDLSSFKTGSGMGSVGSGVMVSGISQLRDPFLDIRFRNEIAEVGMQDEKLGTLKDLESIFDEVIKDGILNQISDFSTMLQKLSGEVGNKEFDRLVKTSAESLTKLFNQYSSQLETIKTDREYSLESVDMKAVNDILGRIEDLNKSIKNSQIHGSPGLELQDQRNNLIDELASYVKIDVKYEKQMIGNVQIDTVKITMLGADGKPLQDGGTPSKDLMLIDGTNPAANFTVTTDGENINGISVNGIAFTSDELGNGSLKGSLEMLTGSGDFGAAGEVRGIAYYEKMLDLMANTFAQTMNELNGKDKPLFESKDGGAITAKSLTISKGWANEEYGITASSDPDAGSGQNDNILKMIESLNGKMDFKFDTVDAAGNPITKTIFSGSFQEYFTNIGSTLGLDIKTTKSLLENHSSVAMDIASLKDSISSVSLDEEGMNLLHYQKSYNAAARLMTTLDEALDTIINKMGVVGR